MAKFLLFFLVIILIPQLVFAAGFSRDLYFGLRNDSDVVRLQEFLRSLGFFTYPQNTGNFFAFTLDAVKKFQITYGVQPIAGYFGPLSRAKANEIISSGTLGGSSLVSPSATSTFYGKVEISSFSGLSEAPEEEIIEIENTDSLKSINITGWTIENSLGNRLQIPKAYGLPGLPNSSLDYLILTPYARALISIGAQDRQMNFRENICTGYFDENYDFRPSLSHNCPTPDASKISHLNDSCLRLIDSTSACRTAKPESYLEINNACSEYLSANLNYAGCVKNYGNRSDFYLDRWLVWLQRKEEFFRNVHDSITLKDQFGKFVDKADY